MNDKRGWSRRRLAAALAAPLAIPAGASLQAGQTPPARSGRVQAAVARLRGRRPAKNISPAFRFIP